MIFNIMKNLAKHKYSKRRINWNEKMTNILLNCNKIESIKNVKEKILRKIGWMADVDDLCAVFSFWTFVWFVLFCFTFEDALRMISMNLERKNESMI